MTVQNYHQELVKGSNTFLLTGTTKNYCSNQIGNISIIEKTRIKTIII